MQAARRLTRKIFQTDALPKGEASDLFAQERTKDTLTGIVGSVMQTVLGKDAYPGIEDKAAYLLYLIVKNHPFTDGYNEERSTAIVQKSRNFTSRHNIYLKP